MVSATVRKFSSCILGETGFENCGYVEGEGMEGVGEEGKDDGDTGEEINTLPSRSKEIVSVVQFHIKKSV